MKTKKYKTRILSVALSGCEIQRTQAKDICEQDPEANIWAQKGWEYGVERTSPRSSPHIVRVIKSRRLRWAVHVAEWKKVGVLSKF